MLRPEYSFLTDPATVYPVTIDPVSNLTADLSNYVSTDYRNQNYDGDAELHAGSYNRGGTVTRSFIRFGDTAIKNTQVTSATLNLYEVWSYACSAAEMNVQAASALNAVAEAGVVAAELGLPILVAQ
ncbi:MAG: DNRLRE domain-containing protein [Actinomycetota bacterium]|nr:DNRLRE domain-containing protein [Actinomycetota bacterium]